MKRILLIGLALVSLVAGLDAYVLLGYKWPAGNIVMNLQGLRFPRAGLYSLDISCDGELSVRLPLRIAEVKQDESGRPTID